MHITSEYENKHTTHHLWLFMLLKTGLLLTSIKDWNKKSATDRTFNNFKVFMRKYYSNLQAVGGLSVHSSFLNLIKELK